MCYTLSVKFKKGVNIMGSFHVIPKDGKACRFTARMMIRRLDQKVSLKNIVLEKWIKVKRNILENAFTFAWSIVKQRAENCAFCFYYKNKSGCTYCPVFYKTQKNFCYFSCYQDVYCAVENLAMKAVHAKILGDVEAEKQIALYYVDNFIAFIGELKEE